MDRAEEDTATESDTSMVSTVGNYDWNETPGCSQFPNHPSCPDNHQQGCMLWAPVRCHNEQRECSSWNEQNRSMSENKEDDEGSDDADDEYESSHVSMEEIDELMEDAQNPFNIVELTALRQTLDAMDQQRTPPRVVEDPDDYIFTSDSTDLRLQRYVDQKSTQSNDPDWSDEQSEKYFTGSEETSGGEKDDAELIEGDTE